MTQKQIVCTVFIVISYGNIFYFVQYFCSALNTGKSCTYLVHSLNEILNDGFLYIIRSFRFVRSLSSTFHFQKT